MILDPIPPTVARSTARSIAGSSLEFDRFYRDERGRVVAVVTSLTGNRQTAEEVAQEAFATAHRRWRRVVTLDRPGDWVLRVALNRAISHHRRANAVAPEPTPTGTVAGEPDHRDPAETPTTTTAPVPSTMHLGPTTTTEHSTSTSTSTTPRSSTAVLRGDGIGDARFGEDIAVAAPKLTAQLGPGERTTLFNGQPILAWGTLIAIFRSVDGRLVLDGWELGAGDVNATDATTDHGITMGTTLEALQQLEPAITRVPDHHPPLDTYAFPDHGGEILADFYPDPAHPDMALLSAGSVPFDSVTVRARDSTR